MYKKPSSAPSSASLQLPAPDSQPASSSAPPAAFRKTRRGKKGGKHHCGAGRKRSATRHHFKQGDSYSSEFNSRQAASALLELPANLAEPRLARAVAGCVRSIALEQGSDTETSSSSGRPAERGRSNPSHALQQESGGPGRKGFSRAHLAEPVPQVKSLVASSGSNAAARGSDPKPSAEPASTSRSRSHLCHTTEDGDGQRQWGSLKQQTASSSSATDSGWQPRQKSRSRSSCSEATLARRGHGGRPRSLGPGLDSSFG